MTISTTTSSVTYQGNGATLVWSFPFVADSPSDLDVYYTDSTGTTVLLGPTQYTVFINPTPIGGLWGIGGTVTYPNSGTPPVPIQPGTYISIVRSVPYEQNVSINNQGAFYPQAVEQALDILELQIQQLETGLAYCVRAPVTDLVPLNELPSASARANGYLAFDSTGQPIITTAPSGGGGSGMPSGTPRRVSTTGTATINVLTSDSWNGVSVYQSGTPVTTIQLPSSQGPYPVFDASGNAGTYPITILPPSGQTINGLSQYIMAFNYQSVVLYLDGVSVVVA